jgi:hypothetical protein
MARWIFAMLAAATAVLSAPEPGVAIPYGAWCSIYFTTSGLRQCNFTNYEQCIATVSGIGGYCERNAPGPSVAEARPAKPRRH